MHDSTRWALPYIDQPPAFWDEVALATEGDPFVVYFPPPENAIGTGRPAQTTNHLRSFLTQTTAAKSALLNPVVLGAPVGQIAPRVIEQLRRLRSEYGVEEAIVTDALLGARIRAALPEMRLTASVLMDIADPMQLPMIVGIFDSVVPSGRIFRNLAALKALHNAFPGRIRLMVNEGCLPGCPVRVQHFYEMNGVAARPASLCSEFFIGKPWLRLMGAWVLPQHLHFYDGLYDELKLAGRVTLNDPEKYLAVVGAYVRREPLMPHEIGGGPASVLDPLEITDEDFAALLRCTLPEQGEAVWESLACRQ